jgi:hypothetical protein
MLRNNAARRRGKNARGVLVGENDYLSSSGATWEPLLVA